MDYPDLRKHVIALVRRWLVKTVLIEDKGSGIQLIQDLRQAKLGVCSVAYLPETGKIT